MIKEPKTLLVLFYTLGWYGSSISLSLYNKWMFTKSMEGFEYPLFTTTIHSIMQLILSSLSLLLVFPSMKPTSDLTLRDYFFKIVPCGLATGLDIGLSNSGIKYVSVSFYTMVKSASPVFVLLFAYLFRLEKPSCQMTLVILLICSGIFTMVSNDVTFNMTGYVQLQIATILSGLRWSMTQILLEKRSMGLHNPLATNLFLAPVIAFSCFILFLFMEGFGSLLTAISAYSVGHFVWTLFLIAIGGFLAFAMTLFEYNLISATSVVTFSVFGIFKEILTISCGIVFYGDTFTFKMVFGLFVSLVGIGLYNFIRLQKVQAYNDAKYTPVEEFDLNEAVDLSFASPTLSNY